VVPDDRRLVGIEGRISQKVAAHQTGIHLLIPQPDKTANVRDRILVTHSSPRDRSAAVGKDVEATLRRRRSTAQSQLQDWVLSREEVRGGQGERDVRLDSGTWVTIVEE